MIVNSEPDLAALFAEMLSMDVEKYIINMAYTGKECLLTLKRYTPDLIVLDIELTDMDGWDLAEKIKQLEPDIPLIVITSIPPRIEDFQRLSTVCDYMMKPVTIDGLQMAVKDALEVPRILKKCIEDVRNSPDRADILSGVEENISIMKQNIADRKLFVLMRQMYPDKKLDKDPAAKLLLENLRKKIDMLRGEIETFKSRECLIYNIKL